MICPRCATTMIKRQDGTPYCYPYWEAAGKKIASTEPLATAPRTPYRVITAPSAVSSVPRGGLLPPPSGEAFRLLQERVAKLESAMADLKRRPEPPARPRFLGQLAEEPSRGEPGEKR